MIYANKPVPHAYRMRDVRSISEHLRVLIRSQDLYGRDEKGENSLFKPILELNFVNSRSS